MLTGDPVRTVTRTGPTTPEQLAALRHEFRAGPAVLLGAYTGALAGWRPGGRFDRSATAVALVPWATPTFWLGLGLVLLMAVGAGAGPLSALLPVAGMRSAQPPSGWWAAVADVGRHLVLPCLTLVAAQYGQYHLLMRSSLATERGNAYILLARAKGLRDAAVRRRHAVPNAPLPTATLALVNAGFIMSASVVVETVYSWPGLGYLAYEALQVPDLPVLHGTFLVFAGAVIAANSAADLVHARIDPRTDLRSALTP
jgi:peptide/nickel transport system permease protein